MTKKTSAALRAAFIHTVPVLLGFLFLGIAYGILMRAAGYGLLWTFLMSWLVFAGSMQYVGLSLLAAPFDPLGALFLTLSVNARHLFYGMALFDKLSSVKKGRPYLIFAMCDETFSILCAAEPPDGVDSDLFYLSIAFLNRWYWIIASMLGAVAGSFMAFNLKGLDFALTALFTVIFIEQWLSGQSRLFSAAGVVISVLCLIVFGPDGFIIPSMALILLAILLGGKRAQKEAAK